MSIYIIPTPKSVKNTKEKFLIAYNTEIVLGSSTGEDEYRFAKMLAEDILKATGLKLRISRGAAPEKNAIVLERRGEVSAEAGNTLRDRIAGEYRLEITETSVRIEAPETVGILYGVQSLRQIISQAGALLPGMLVQDRPSIANRGFFHDATRGRVEKLESYKRLADLAAYYRLNQLQLYVEHTYMFRDFSQVWRDDTPLTAEDILELDAYCSSLCIELVPAIATFGHLCKVLSCTDYAPLCEMEDSDKERFSFITRMRKHTLNISDERAWEFVKKMLDEFMPLFRSRKFNLCGDETFDLGKGRSKKLADEKGTHRLYVDFVKRIAEYLVENGRRPLFWGDIIVGAPELLQELPKETVCLTWGYSENEHHRCAQTMDSVGAIQYLCPGVHGWMRLMNRLSAAYANISRMCEYACRYNAEGLLNTDWGDYGHVNDPAFSYQGLIYGAEGAWCGELPAEKELNRRISAVEYGDASESAAGLFSEFGEYESMSWGHLVQYCEYMTDGCEHSLEEQREFFGRIDPKSPAAQNKALDSCIERLAALMPSLNVRGRELAGKYLMTAAGQKLINRIAAAVMAKHLKNASAADAAVCGSTKELAAELETWFDYYKEGWRSSSKESELYRISNVIYWCADFLRTLE